MNETIKIKGTNESKIDYFNNIVKDVKKMEISEKEKEAMLLTLSELFKVSLANDPELMIGGGVEKALDNVKGLSEEQKTQILKNIGVNINPDIANKIKEIKNFSLNPLS